MSIKLVNQVLEQNLSPVKKLILVVLADNANDSGLCWPSIRNIAKRASVSERTVQRTIRELIRQRYLHVEHRQRKDGSQASNKYYFNFEKLGVTK